MGLKRLVGKFYHVLCAPFPDDKLHVEATEENMSYLHTSC